MPSGALYACLLATALLTVVHFALVYYHIPIELHAHLGALPPSPLDHAAKNPVREEEGVREVIKFHAPPSEEQERIIEKQRGLISLELEGYELGGRVLKSLQLEAGGQPLRTVIFTSWRSGSNFLGSILEQNAGTFYYWEPFAHRGWVQYRDGPQAQGASDELHDLLTCNYSNLDAYMDYATFEAPWMLELNTRLGQHCRDQEARIRVCANSQFLSRMCRQFPFQVAKLARMRLALGRWLLEDPGLNVRIIYLIRDPRGIIQSRRLSANSNFCQDRAICASPEILCTNLQDDYETTKQFAREFPEKFMVVRYEELALDPIRVVKCIFRFNGWEYTQKIEDYLKAHTTREDIDPYSVYRQSQRVVFQWRERLNWTQVREIQELPQCAAAIRSWGYRLAPDPSDNLTRIDPLGEFNFTVSVFVHCQFMS